MQQNGPRRSLAATLSERRRKEGRKEGRENKARPKAAAAAPSPPIACLSSRLAFCSEVAIGVRQRGWKSRRSLLQNIESLLLGGCSTLLYPMINPAGLVSDCECACLRRNGIVRTKSASAAILSFIYVRGREKGASAYDVFT